MKATSDFHSCHFSTATADPSAYQPISCEFHDLLEVQATTRKPAQIRFRDAQGDVQLRNAVVNDVYARQGVEYLAISTGEVVRLDQLVALDGAKLADF